MDVDNPEAAAHSASKPQRPANIFELLDDDKSDSEVRETLKSISAAKPKPIAIKSKGITREIPRSSVGDRLEAKLSKKQRKKQRKDKLKHAY